MKWFVYVLACEDGSYYVGATMDVVRRFREHCDGTGGAYTRSHRPLKVLFQESHPDRSSALRREREIKNWSRQKKQALVISVCHAS
ncbi:GIY-YIG nuclease family protein [Candidatus Uhrbacteria bacterium]|nr:GIY-YIG nuclease family protein [Candidatus Uhrbacteria bacterium]